MWAATHYHTRAWQTLIYGKECYIVIVIYLQFKHKQSQMIFIQLYAKNVHRSIMKRTTNSRQMGTIENVNIINERRPKIVKKTEYLIAISRPTGENWQLKTLVVAISDSRSSIVRQEFSIATHPVWKHIFL